MKKPLAALAASRLHRTLYHFTDVRNVESIARHGLLSLRQLHEQDVPVPAAGGNRASHDIDERIGMDRYVHLCLLDQHPMEFRARERGEIGKTTYLRVMPEVLDHEGVMFTVDVANKTGVVARPIAAIDEWIDLEVIYQQTRWKEPAIQERLQRAPLRDTRARSGSGFSLAKGQGWLSVRFSFR